MYDVGVYVRVRVRVCEERYVKVCSRVRGCCTCESVYVCMSIRGRARVCVGVCVRLCDGTCRCVDVCV